MDNSESVHPGITLLGIVVSIIIFIAVWYIGGILLNLLDMTRGLSNDKLQSIFKEIFMPGLGGYAAMASVDSWIKRANKKIVFYVFSSLILVLIGSYIWVMSPVASAFGENLWTIMFTVLTIFASVIGAFIYMRKNL
jgi:hypothetical protein